MTTQRRERNVSECLYWFYAVVTGVKLIAGVPTWSELNTQLEAVQAEKAMLSRHTARVAEQLRVRLQQSEQMEGRLRSDIRAFELDSLRKQHAALKTSA